MLIIISSLTVANAGVFRTIAAFGSIGARAPSARRHRGEGSKSMVYDEFGHIPDLEDAQKAVDQARSIVCIRLNNVTMVGTVEISPPDHVMSVPIGIRPMNAIYGGKPGVHLVLTGLTADARFLLRLAKRKALEHFHLFDKPISTRLLSQFLGNIIRDNYMSNNRPLVSHLFVIGDNSIWEIGCFGVVQEIVGGAAGLDREKVLEVLEKQYSKEMSREEAKDLIITTYRSQLQAGPDSRVIRIFELDESSS